MLTGLGAILIEFQALIIGVVTGCLPTKECRCPLFHGRLKFIVYVYFNFGHIELPVFLARKADKRSEVMTDVLIVCGGTGGHLAQGLLWLKHLKNRRMHQALH